MKIHFLRFISLTAYLFLLLILLTSSENVSAQPADSAKKWKVLTEIYLLFPYIKGDIGVGNYITVPVEGKPKDIFTNLTFGAMLNVEVHNNRWAFISDFLYANLNQDVTPTTLISSGTVSAKQIIWEPSGLYRLTSYLEAGVGGRLNFMESGFDIFRKTLPEGTEEIAESASKTWFDPILIARVSTSIKDKWLFNVKGDLGGFGLGSDFTWQVQAYAGYRFGKLFQLTAGYKILSIDYDRGTDTKRFIYNVDTSGPVVRFGFNF
jgi:hypothetical protein